ncbi:Protein of unknown function [Nitrosovibrio sp. Nv4]|nr:Protein of unknown function [Nitrosovibrio sp. Nv4]
MQTRFIKPAPGLLVRMPNGNVLPAEGAEVEMNSYWLRRLEDGDIDVVRTVKGKKS